jgi:hypothetical protein
VSLTSKTMHVRPWPLASRTSPIHQRRCGHHLQGGFGEGSGSIQTDGTGLLASMKIGGSVLGGGGMSSGSSFGGVTGC